MKTDVFLEKLKTGEFDGQLRMLYGDSPRVLARQRERYQQTVERFCELFPGREEIHIFSAPGRTEIGGNHTDHQRGCALGAAVSMDILAVVAFHDEGIIRLQSKGHDIAVVDLSDLSIRESETRKSVSLVRGIAARFAEMGVTIGGFDAYTVSDVLRGSGLSSSAAFETLVGTIINVTYHNGEASPTQIAKIGQYAENVYYRKNSGLLDQMICSVGGFVFLDFKDAVAPKAVKYRFDCESAGYHLCITDTKGSHSKLYDEYAAVPTEMKSVADQFGKDVLREVDEEAFYDAIPRLRGKCSDRAILRAMHFFAENKRAVREAQALGEGDIEAFFRFYRGSADSSARLLQNLYSTQHPAEQGIPLAIAVSKRLLGDDAAVRVHGGGFAGTIQAFVPVNRIDAYREAMEALFGEGCCHILRVRSVGGIKII